MAADTKAFSSKCGGAKTLAVSVACNTPLQSGDRTQGQIP